jgi:hypothetical protein
VVRLQLEQRLQLIKAETVEQVQPILIQDHPLLMPAAAVVDSQTVQVLLAQVDQVAEETDRLREMELTEL